MGLHEPLLKLGHSHQILKEYLPKTINNCLLDHRRYSLCEENGPKLEIKGKPDFRSYQCHFEAFSNRPIQDLSNSLEHTFFFFFTLYLIEDQA